MGEGLRPCEPVLHNLQEFSIGKLREEQQRERKLQQQRKSDQIKSEVKETASNESLTFEGMDCVDINKEKLRRSVSFQYNKYLECRWKKFQENIPKKPLIIVSYDKLHKVKSPQPRKLMLNGEFFSKYNELWPVPHGYIKLG